MKGRSWCTPAEFARLVGVSHVTVIKWIKKGKIKAGRLPSGRYAIPKEEVEKVLKQLRNDL
ncbi:MAG: helix-turn-helix domain-containing protein [Candidatus Hydrothermae bacterium]|nr:helix-turn-helix domain-containing protein [Candidatus Hydrothermae bacterium]